MYLYAFVPCVVSEVVNGKIPAQVCNEEKHSKSKRNRNAYCMDCGEQLNRGK